MSNRSLRVARTGNPDSRPTGPGGAAPTARDLPAIRRAMIGWTQDAARTGARTWMRLICQAATVALPDFAHEKADADAIVDRWTHLLPRAEMFYVAPAMTTLVHHAADSLTDYRLHFADIPADYGLLLFADPLRDPDATEDPEGWPISLVAWSIKGSAVYLDYWVPNSYEATGDTLGYAIPGTVRVLAGVGKRLPREAVPGQLYPCHGYLFQRTVPMMLGGSVDRDYTQGPVGDPESDDGSRLPDAAEPSSAVTLQRLVVATWLLMGQKITTEERVAAAPTGHAAARRRADPEPDVRVIDLRAVNHPPRLRRTRLGPHLPTLLVRPGPWRNQWHPSRGEHRPIWIDLHRAGPEDAPLIGGERVNVLRR